MNQRRTDRCSPARCLAVALLCLGPVAGRAEEPQALPSAASAAVDFVQDVQPIFARHCEVCHGPDKQRSSFRLDRRSVALKGGDLGEDILPHHSADSPLIRFAARLEEGMEMPPAGEGEPLTAEEIGILRRWIDDGAAWPDAAAGEPAVDRTAWWSLQPLARPAIPHVAELDREWVRTPVDAFIVARLREQGLAPSVAADRRTLIRRLTFDLQGLPPTPAEVERFVNDPDSLAYERLVDRLLEGERYGERWARHWLDVAHYADSHGHDQDRPRPNAWPYRDYVIRAFNEDKPYAQFVAEQVAGDILHPGDAQALAATGFLAAGPFDESSLVSINENSIDRLIGQYLDRDDIVTNTMMTFTAMTVGCARCHDHKFDAITQRDYYALQAVFAGIDKAERRYDSDPEIARKRSALRQTLDGLHSRSEDVVSQLLTPERRSAVRRFEQRRASTPGAWSILEPTAWTSTEGTILKALIDRSILAVGPAPEKDTYTIAGSVPLPSVRALRLEVLPDETLPAQGPGRAGNGNLHLTELRIRAFPTGQPDAAVPVAVKSAIADFDQAGWDVLRAIDGDATTGWGVDPAEGRPHEAVFEFTAPVAFPEGVSLSVELAQDVGRQHLIGRLRLSAADSNESDALVPLPAAVAEQLAIPEASRTDEQSAAVSGWLWERQLHAELAALPPESRVFCGTNQFVADGTFRPAAEPREVHLLLRGDVLRPADVAVPGTVVAVAGPQDSFTEKPLALEGDRRAALSQWLIDPAQPLTWRVMANRIWHYHFGKGLVDTPSDFGHMGGLPSHPQLLDWLAAEFRDSGGSMKHLHRLIVCSSVYRQVSAHNEAASLQDADNRLLWRMNRQRLDAESVRDAVLAACGALDTSMYGPPVMQFVVSPGIHITPDADYQTFDIDSAAARRRSIYRFVLRTRPDPFYEVLDCPDPSQAAPARVSSLSALQALALWNDQFMLRSSERLAELAESKSSDLSERVEFAALRVLNRAPGADEARAWAGYAREYGLANLCRVLLNSSEFLFVE